MEKIEINANVGDEVLLVHGDKKLVVKIGPNAIIPDPVETAMLVINKDADAVFHIAQRVYYRNPDAEVTSRERLARIRDEIFAEIKPEETAPKMIKRPGRKAKTEEPKPEASVDVNPETE